jgi:hypothetical protein
MKIGLVDFLPRLLVGNALSRVESNGLAIHLWSRSRQEKGLCPTLHPQVSPKNVHFHTHCKLKY